MILYGASGHAKVIIDILEANGQKIDFIVDDNPEVTELLGYDVRRNTGEYDEAIISIGSCEIRKKVVEGLKVGKYATSVHPSAVVSPRATIDEGTVVMQGAIVQSCAKIGKHCIVNTGASVDHDCEIGDFVHVAPHATVLGGVKVGEGSWIGAGAVVKQYITVGKNCMIGAGAVVLHDVPDGATVVGVPGKEIK
jgi:sugar O-acyltransferase (sialic acid O-acetyltransferase NeuD family)